ncbi:DNA adenine methylase [Brevibacillus sp. FIR094]|uniref:DNA adenine methylase n=1 Tax=Brevibacillus sp. FIR094 TaxID=3134809 RepID=UPI003D24F254
MNNNITQPIIAINNRIAYDENVPHIIKYMGSKRNILDFVIQGIEDCYLGGAVCDLFAGSSVLSGSLRSSVPVLSNDIQVYSAILAKTYLSNYDWNKHPNILNEIVEEATERAETFFAAFPDLVFDYNVPLTIEEFNELEKKQQKLIDKDFSGFQYHLFAKDFSGTYWSFRQCVWIDALRSVAEDYKKTPFFYAIISSLMFAMSYNSQSTGHYAQYRDANTESSMNDILIYRQKEILPYFIRKFEEFQQVLGENTLPHQVISMDYLDCLDMLEPDTTVYADPPYCFVHYSRFYHAIETLVKYDYPEVKYKGRYRTDRHQSPFCIRSKVTKAFQMMFVKIKNKHANLVLSYSNTGMIELDKLQSLAEKCFGNAYTVEVRSQGYLHSTMGRRDDKSREVKEWLLLAKRRI